MSKPQSIVHMASSGGHREDYQRVLSRILGLEPSTGKVSPRNVITLVRAERLLFGTLDDDVRGFVLIALARMMLGKKTAALFLRPHSCFGPSGLQTKVKHTIFAFFARSRNVSVCTILPFELEPRYREVATYGLADPQLWDRQILPFEPSTDCVRRLKKEAGRRKIMAFIGTASPFKGVAQICEMMAHNAWDDSVCVVFAGRVPDDTQRYVRKAEKRGAVVFPRFVSNDELDAIYEVADLVWAGYEPGYDQASGNFGRALQFGKVPVVRSGTMIARLARLMNYPVIAVDFDDPAKSVSALQAPLTATSAAPDDQIAQWQSDFVEAMAKSL